MNPRAETVNGAYMIEARAHAQAAEELRQGAGKGRGVDDLETERLFLAYAMAAAGAVDAARLRGRREALAEAIEERRTTPSSKATTAARFGRCLGCDAPVRWAKVGSGKDMPIDIMPVPGGNVAFVGPDRCRVLREGDATDGPTYRSHFDSCPDAARWRERAR